jgi:putative endonuclease
LVYCEKHGSIIDAIRREKQMKKWYRKRKIELIEKYNPEWKNLYYDI